ncbi:MAG: Nucleotide-binding protein [Alphaproteobacteria bacterium MarineAlpha2_Bin1]|nr:MAG: Nucleotide-binding protein [Alphaproteobacteria bacterium MarineAlpha2_Bin1]
MVNKEKLFILFVTGRSGAGLSTVLKILEDLGYETMDNVPVSLLLGFFNKINLGEEKISSKAIAVGLNIRTSSFDAINFIKDLESIKNIKKFKLETVFLDCDENTLSQRYTKTRRKHPLAKDSNLIDGIRVENEIIKPLREIANLVIDTSLMGVNDLRQLISGNYTLKDTNTIAIGIKSFAFPNGLPRESDLVFDVRFLKNPFYDVSLRSKTGRDSEVGKYIMTDPEYKSFFDNLSNMISRLLPLYKAEGKAYLTISIGCTGGQHRSVFVAEEIANSLISSDYKVEISHREL